MVQNIKSVIFLQKPRVRDIFILVGVSEYSQKFFIIFHVWYSAFYYLNIDTKFINISCIHQKFYYKTCFWQALWDTLKRNLFLFFFLDRRQNKCSHVKYQPWTCWIQGCCFQLWHEVYFKHNNFVLYSHNES